MVEGFFGGDGVRWICSQGFTYDEHNVLIEDLFSLFLQFVLLLTYNL